MNEWSFLSYDSAVECYTGPGTTSENEMEFSMKHAPGAGLITQPDDLQSRALLLCYGCPLQYGVTNILLGYTLPDYSSATNVTLCIAISNSISKQPMLCYGTLFLMILDF